MVFQSLSRWLQRLQAGADSDQQGGAADSTRPPSDGQPSQTVVDIDLPTGDSGRLVVDAPDVDPDVLGQAVEAQGGSVTRGVQGQSDDGAVIPVSTEREEVDLSDTYFDDESLKFDYIRDDRIQDVRDKQIDYNQRVGRWIMHKDDLVPSIKERLKGLLLGEDGLQVDPDDPDNDADQRLADHLEDVYTGNSDVGPHVNPANVVDDILDQNFMNARWVGRATDLRYLDLETLELVVDGSSGDRIFVQESTDYTVWEVDDDDPHDAVDFDYRRSDPQALTAGDDVFEARLYDRPPLEAVADDVVGKMEMKFLKARKAQIGSVGGLFIKVKPPEYLPEDEYFDRVPNPYTDDPDDTITKLERELQQGIDRAFDTLQDYKSGTVMAIPNNWDVDQIELPDNSESLDEQIRGYNQSIARRLLYPLDLVELKSGPELSRETLFRTVINTLQGWREEILTVFDQFADVQKEIHDLQGDVTHSFPAFANEDEKLLVQALQYAGPAGMTEDEVRQTLNSLEGFDLDTDRDTGDMPPAGGPTDPQQRQDSMDDMLNPDADQSGQPAQAAYTPPEGLDLYELEGWTQASVWDAYLSVGGSHTSCVREMTGELRNPDAWCAALKDEALGTDLWRKGSGAAPSDGLQRGDAARCWAADPDTITTSASLDEVADAVQDATDADMMELQSEDDYVAFSRGGVDPREASGDDGDADPDDFDPVVIVAAGDDQYDITGLSDDEADSVQDAVGGGSGNAESALARLQGQSDGDGPFSMVPEVPDDPDRITRDMLVTTALWKRDQMRQAQGALPDGLVRTVSARDWNPSLHPRDPDTGQFVERPWSLSDDLSGLSDDVIRDANTTELAEFLHDTPGEPDMNSVLQDDGVTIDGIPDDVDTVSDLRERANDPQDDADVPTNPRDYDDIAQGDIIKAPDGEPVEVVGKDVYSDDRILTVERPDGEREAIDVDAMRRNTIDEYSVDSLSEMPSVQSGDIDDLSLENISTGDPRFVQDPDVQNIDEGDYVRIDPRTLADRDRPFVAEVTDKRFKGAEFTVTTADGDSLDVGAGSDYDVDAHLQPVETPDVDVDLSDLDPDNPDEGYLQRLRGSDVVTDVREGDIVTVDGPTRQKKFATITDGDSNGSDYTLTTPDGETIDYTAQSDLRIEDKYNPPVEPSVDPDVFVTGDDVVGRTDLTDLPDDMSAAERREELSGEFLSDDVINAEMVQQEQIPEGAYIAYEIGEDDVGITGHKRIRRVDGYEIRAHTGEKFLQVTTSSGRTSTIRASKVGSEGYRPYEPGDNPDVTIPDDDWSDDVQQRQQAVKSVLDDVLPKGPDSPDENSDGDISDDQFEQAKEQIAEHLSRAKTKEHAETVAARLTSVGDDIDRAHAVKSFTPWKDPTTYYSISSDGEERVNHHELGHAVADSFGVAGGSNVMDGDTYPMPDFDWKGEDVPNRFGIKPPMDSDQWEDGKSSQQQDTYNLDDWKDDVDAQVGQGLDGRNFSPADSVDDAQDAEMLYLSDPPGMNEPRTFSIVEHDPDDVPDHTVRGGHPVRLEDRKGNQHAAVITEEFGELRVDWADDDEYAIGTNDEIQGTRKTMPDQWQENPPDPDDYLSDDLPDGDADDRFRNLADAVNRSWYRQAAAAREMDLTRASEYSIRDGYSTKQAHETMSRIHEVMRADGLDPTLRARNARTLVKYHPDLLQAYRGVYDIPPAMKEILNQVLEREGADYRFPEPDLPDADRDEIATAVDGAYTRGGF